MALITLDNHWKNAVNSERDHLIYPCLLLATDKISSGLPGQEITASCQRRSAHAQQREES